MNESFTFRLTREEYNCLFAEKQRWVNELIRDLPGDWKTKDGGYTEFAVNNLLAACFLWQKSKSNHVEPGSTDDPVLLHKEIFLLRSQLKGPEGFQTWQDAALAERILRLEAEKEIQRLKDMAPEEIQSLKNETFGRDRHYSIHRR